ncbi:hypothetical protein ACQR1I_11310 [Bradyrhizobium sp. HKCCYLS2038]|uniref:hypothetical protein n=1 Tax=unclassified Bradyrhizobium TaxID=2631580 RepID=UPI003EBA5922
MSWKEERDALIAQTMAFVQSVTGKPADFAQFELPSVPVGTPVTPQQTALARTTPPVAERAPTGAALAARSDTLSSGATPSEPVRTIGGEAGARQASPMRPAKPASEHFTSIASQLDLQRDMQTEIRARVARFRAHQERFNRERQEYFSTTLARLKASAAGTVIPED